MHINIDGLKFGSYPWNYQLQTMKSISQEGASQLVLVAHVEWSFSGYQLHEHDCLCFGQLLWPSSGQKVFPLKKARGSGRNAGNHCCLWSSFDNTYLYQIFLPIWIERNYSSMTYSHNEFVDLICNLDPPHQNYHCLHKSSELVQRCVVVVQGFIGHPRANGKAQGSRQSHHLQEVQNGDATT